MREGLAETLTVLRLNVASTLACALRSTNSIESLISICRPRSSNVKDWRNGHLHLPALRVALDEHIAPQNVGIVHHDDTVNAI